MLKNPHPHYRKTLTSFLALFLALSCDAYAAGREPCDRGAGGVSHCDGERFVCRNGTISQSTKKCGGSYDTPAKKALGGQVVAIQDGDTLEIMADGKPLRIRLAEIDTPESKQPYGTEAKQALAALCYGKQARIEVQDIDRYQRTVARVYCEGVDTSAELVRMGAAWVYRHYAKDAALFALEDEARAAGRGLWALPPEQREPPWMWKHK